MADYGEHISKLEKAVQYLADEDHAASYKMKWQYQRSYEYCLYEDLQKRWSAPGDVIKTWTIGGWDEHGWPAFSAYLGGRWEKELWYNKDGSYLGDDLSCIEYPLCNFWLSSEEYVITLPEMRLCFRKGARERLQEEIKRLKQL